MHPFLCYIWLYVQSLFYLVPSLNPSPKSENADQSLKSWFKNNVTNHGTFPFQFQQQDTVKGNPDGTEKVREVKKTRDRPRSSGKARNLRKKNFVLECRFLDSTFAT